MAVAHRASAAASTANPTTTFAVTIPAGVLADDLLFLAVTSRSAAASLSVTDNDTGGNAWARMDGQASNQGSVWWKRATSATASKTITVANAVNSSAGVLSCFSGGDTGATPYSNASVATNGVDDFSATGITPSQADSFICVALCPYQNDVTPGTAAFATLGTLEPEFALKLSTGGNDCAAWISGKISTGGPTATGNLTWDTAEDVISIIWAIKPLAAGGGSGRLIGGQLINRSKTAGRLVA